MLLVETGGAAVHLAAETADGAGHSALPRHWSKDKANALIANLASDTLHELMASRWSSRTLCGRQWSVMAAGEAGPLYPDQLVQLAPTCQRCLASLDRRFPTPAPDERLGLLAELAADAVQEHGSAEIIGVPGDQVAALRAEIRRVFRQRFAYPGKSWFVNDLLLIACDEVTEQVRLDRGSAVVRSLHQGAPTEPVADSGWRIRWHTWV